MKLVVIEGLGKKDTIQKYLGEGYEVFPTMGHIRDLPPNDINVDFNNNFEPNYQIIADKHELVDKLKKKAKNAEAILLATDPDREGEAISWHIAYILGLKAEDKCRIEFNEISKSAVSEALKKPRAIDQQLVDAQQARRILDRIMGYKISPIICRAIKPKLSAGRVQSVALKLVVDREKEIRDFKPEEYWNVISELNKLNEDSPFKALLSSYKGKKIKPAKKEEVDEILKNLEQATYKVQNIKKSKTKSNPLPPYITSTMQQDALNKLGLPLAKSSRCAQTLYEGVEVSGHGKIALITYIRTDSTRVSAEAQAKARTYIAQKYGNEYVPAKPNVFTTKKNAQDAHEAIRPISVDITPSEVRGSLKPDEYELYKLIYERFLASQMTSALYDSVAVDVEANDYIFHATGRTLDFAGYTIIYKSYSETEENNAKIPRLTENEVLKLEKMTTEQKFTKAPARYTEASLVKVMEEKGIGRPATYAPIITNLTSGRGYVQKDGKSLVPTDLGEAVSDYLEKYFHAVINVKFTANMESRLDDIADNGEKWQDVISSFWNGFKTLLGSADKTSVGFKPKPIETDIVCEKCGHKMLIREGRYGKFLGCSNFPECRNIKPLNPTEPQKTANQKPVGVCPVCGKPVVSRKSRTGKIFYSCTGYPDCKFMSWNIPTGEKCPQCGSFLYKKMYKTGAVIECEKNCGYKVKEEEKKDGTV